MNSFSADITKFVQKTKLSADTVVRKLAFDAFRSILLRSPVDTGRFRASWRVSINQTDLSVESPRDSTKYGTTAADATKAESGLGLTYTTINQTTAETTAQTAKFGQTVIISNNLPYADALENGYSKQAPAGILAVAYLELTTNFAKTVTSIP